MRTTVSRDDDVASAVDAIRRERNAAAFSALIRTYRLRGNLIPMPI